MSGDRYLTLAGEGHGQLREKASRFIAVAFPVGDEGSFRARMEAYVNEHRGARHFCYAWVMGDAGERHRAHDAGEPSGTAGKPILMRIQAAGLTWCGVIVVRWSGGKLLGKGGLVRAYGEAARLAIDAASKTERIVTDTLLLRCGYDQLEALRAAVIAHGGEVLSGDYGERCELQVRLPRSVTGELLGEQAMRAVTVVPQEVK